MASQDASHSRAQVIAERRTCLAGRRNTIDRFHADELLCRLKHHPGMLQHPQLLVLQQGKAGWVRQPREELVFGIGRIPPLAARWIGPHFRLCAHPRGFPNRHRPVGIAEGRRIGGIAAKTNI